MGTKRLLYISLPPDGTHHSDWQEATLLFLKLSYFLYVESKLIKVTDTFCYIQNTWLLLSFHKCVYYRDWCLPLPTQNPSPTPTTTLPHRHRSHDIQQCWRKYYMSSEWDSLVNWIIWSTEMKPLCFKLSSFLNKFSTVHTHLFYESGFAGPQGHLSKCQVSLGGILDTNKEHIGYWIQCALVWRTCPRRWYFQNQNSLWLSLYHLSFFFFQIKAGRINPVVWGLLLVEPEVGSRI